jgi:hypothetical protein
MSSGQQEVLMSEDSCGFADHMNEYDDKLKTFTIQEEDQKSILMIGGIKVFLPDIQVKANAHDESAAVGERQPSGDCHDEGEDIRSFPRRRRRGAHS